jgi:hypothetical protein
MPYALKRSGQRYYMINEDTGHKFSHLPIPKERALRQMRALYASENGYKLRSRSLKSRPYNSRLQKSIGSYKRKSRLLGGRINK